MKTEGWLSLIALELAVIIFAIAYGAIKANQAVAAAQANPILSFFSGL